MKWNEARLPIPLRTLQRQLDKSACTLWRWRKAGLLRTVNLSGKLYVTADALDEFLRRLEAGEFAKPPVTPSTPRLEQKDGGHR